MRKVVLSSTTFHLDEPEFQCSLTDELWHDGYEYITMLNDAPILQRFWKHQYGVEAENPISVNMLNQLTEELDKCIACYPMEESLVAFSLEFKLLINKAVRYNCSLQIIAQ